MSAFPGPQTRTANRVVLMLPNCPLNVAKNAPERAHGYTYKPHMHNDLHPKISKKILYPPLSTGESRPNPFCSRRADSRIHPLRNCFWNEVPCFNQVPARAVSLSGRAVPVSAPECHQQSGTHGRSRHMPALFVPASDRTSKPGRQADPGLRPEADGKDRDVGNLQPWRLVNAGVFAGCRRTGLAMGVGRELALDALVGAGLGEFIRNANPVIDGGLVG
jgi:hypothetical protein